jgi:putative ABC transport system substrate-binding protein
MVTRRRLVLMAGVGMLAASRWASAQPAGRRFRIGWVASAASSFREPQALAFVQRLAELGLVEGRNLVIERRHPDGRLEQMAAVSAALGKLQCDAYFGGGGEANLAALTQASRTTPIVFVAVDFDPVATGDVASLARPGGRVTGVTALQSTLPAKRLELLKELLPGMGKVAVFTNEDTSAQLALVQGTARRLGLALHVVDLRRPPFDFRAGFMDASRAKADALFVLGSSLWVPARREITELALQWRLPTVFHQGHWVEAGGLMSYGFDFVKMWRRGAEMLAHVLRGGKPSEMPMEQPTEYELMFNLKTARALGVTVPPSLLVRADRVIE